MSTLSNSPIVGWPNLSLLLCILISSIANSSYAQDYFNLSAEGKKRQAAHQFLFGEFANDRQLTISGSGDGKILQEIVVSTKRHEFTGEMQLPLPEGSQRVIGMFRYLILKGENLDKLDGLKLLPYAPAGRMHHSKKNADFYRVQVASMPVPSEDMPPSRSNQKSKMIQQSL